MSIWARLAELLIDHAEAALLARRQRMQSQAEATALLERQLEAIGAAGEMLGAHLDALDKLHPGILSDPKPGAK